MMSHDILDPDNLGRLHDEMPDEKKADAKAAKLEHKAGRDFALFILFILFHLFFLSWVDDALGRESSVALGLRFIVVSGAIFFGLSMMGTFNGFESPEDWKKISDQDPATVQAALDLMAASPAAAAWRDEASRRGRSLRVRDLRIMQALSEQERINHDKTIALARSDAFSKALQPDKASLAAPEAMAKPTRFTVASDRDSQP